MTPNMQGNKRHNPKPNHNIANAVERLVTIEMLCVLTVVLNLRHG